MNDITFKNIESKLKKRENYKDIKKAYDFAEKVHKGEKRLSGDDFITHPLEIVNILLDLNVDDTTLIAAFVHETMKKNKATYDELSQKFGEEVAMLVDSLTKINHLELVDNTENSAIYLRKVLVGLAEDVRVLYIKLADRLHNMRTNWATNPLEQKQKAVETMNVLVPIAHRLGINSIKSELENLCLYYLKPEVYNDILEKLNDTVEDLNDYLEEMKEELTSILTEANIDFKIKGRVKSVYSIYNKLNNGKKWDNIYDILALRIFVEKESECYQAIGLIHARFRPMAKRFKDYIAIPKENMYQSLHTTVYGVEGKVFEIQVRTYEMDEIAEKGIASHWSYKEKGAKKIQNLMEQKLELFRNIIDANAKAGDLEFASSINNDLFSDLIYVYTPKGDVVELPKGSTPIDFAYRIHSGVGDKTTGAIVNDQIVPLSYELQNEDVINIKTTANGKPNKNWLTFVKTTQAKNKIKAYFSKKDREEYIVKGREILEANLRKRKLKFSEVLTTEKIDKIKQDLKLKDLDDIYLSIGSLRYTATYIINLANEEKNNVEDLLFDRKETNSKINYKSDILVEGAQDIMVNISKCCMPIKGDDIVGYITKGQGISIHKKDCPNVNLKNERLINVSWNELADNFYYTNILVYSNSSKNILAELITEVGKKDSIVKSCNTRETEDFNIYDLSIRVRNKNELESICNHLERMANVIKIEK